MDTVKVKVVDKSETSTTVEFPGNPDNACEGTFFDLFAFAADISWKNRLTIDWSKPNVTWTLNMEHDGFPSHQVNIGNDRVYLYDPVDAGNSPWSLFPPKEIEVIVPGSL